MTAVPSTLQRLRSPAHTETVSLIGGPRPAERSVDFDFERSRESRRRHRILISARHLTAFFAYHSDYSQSLH